MFVSLPEHKFYVPTELAGQDAAYWRSVALSTNTPWFILSVQPDDPGANIDTFLIAWDTDLVGAVAPRDVKVESLLMVSRRGRAEGWHPVEIAEIWEATDPEDESTSVMLVDIRGKEYCGMFMQPAKSAKRTKLVIRIRPLSSS